MTAPDWNAIEAALSALECDVTPSGMHGQCAALYCRVQPPPADLGLVTSATDPAAWAVLREMATATAAQLAEADLAFAPLLPADDEGLARRLEALAEWAECFAFGLSLGGRFEPKRLSAEGQECLQHMLDLSRINPDEAELEQAEAEEAYTELVEFLRIAVMTLYVEFRTLDASPSTSVH